MSFVRVNHLSDPICTKLNEVGWNFWTLKAQNTVVTFYYYLVRDFFLLCE